VSNAKFNPAPGWPVPPEGWVPPVGWTPDASWPPAPAGWEFWVTSDTTNSVASEPAPVAPVRPAFPKRPLPTPMNAHAQPAATPEPFAPHPIPQQPTVAAYAPQPVPVQNFAPAPVPQKKKRKPMVITAIVVASALVISGGVFAFSSMYDYVYGDKDSPVTADGKTPETVEEALTLYHKTADEMTLYMTSFEGGVDFPSHQENIDAWTVQVEEAAADPALGRPGDVQIFIDLVLDLKTQIDEEYATWKELYVDHPDYSKNESGTPVEAELDKVSGGVSPMIIDTRCSDGSIDIDSHPIACVGANEPTTVHVETDLINDPRFVNEWDSYMLHEFAHVIQFKYIYWLRTSEDYINLFDSDEEHHADCMAWSVKSDYNGGYGGTCTPEQLAAAKKVWDGSFFTTS